MYLQKTRWLTSPNDSLKRGLVVGSVILAIILSISASVAGYITYHSCVLSLHSRASDTADAT